MKRINTIIVAMIMVMTLSQCKKEEPITPADEGVYITLNVKDDNGSRVIVNTTTGTVDFENGDKIYVASGGKYVGTLTYEGSLFTGSVFNAVAGYPLHFYFLGNITPAETLTYGETDSCSVVITDQTEHLPVISYAPSTENYGMTTDFTSHLLNKCALVKFDVTSTSESATCVTGFKNKVTVNFAENTLTPTQEGDGIITLPAGTGERWAILLPQGALAAGGAGSAYSADDAYTGTRGAVPAIGLNAFLTVGIPVTLEAGGGGGGNHEYVDLGLPSGTLWATCNVGANAPEEYGDYFAWGETEPKDVYNWSTYQYCNGGYSKLTKYCNNSSYGYNGFTDNLTILQPYDDAATVNWGDNWRIPTREEWRELLQNTTYTWTIQNGVYGRLFTAINGNSLFLPAAGSRHESSFYYVGSDGNYWSSSLYTNYPEGALNYYFDSEFHTLSYYTRYDGFSVRAVYSLEQNLSHITATANPSEGGEISGNGPYIIGSTCTLIATANEGYAFDNWTENDNQVSTDANYTFTVTSNRTLVANFTVQTPNYAINVSSNPNNGGTVTGGGTYQQGQTCTLTATANNGYTFTNWTENGNQVSTNANYTFTVTGDRTLVANFAVQAPNNYTINVSANPNNGGTVTGGGTYQQGQTCTLTATANNGYTFTNWTENGNQVSTNANYTFTVTGNRLLVANFSLQSYTISASVSPSNGGTVTGGGTYQHGQTCTLTATANTGYTFVNWTRNGNVVSTTPTFSVTVMESATYVAHFSNSYEITATANPANGGMVTGAGTYTYGATCTLMAITNAGYTFINWTRNGEVVSTVPTFSVMVTESVAYVAHFSVNSYEITTTANPTNGGTVTGAGTYNYGTSVTMRATANVGYTFVNWTSNGEVVSTVPNFTITVTETASFVAHFSLNTYEITAMANPTSGGTVTGGGTYVYGATATLRATANMGYTFTNWTRNGVVVSTTPTFSVTVTESADYVAHFSLNTYEITATANPTNGGTVTGAGTYTYGATCTLTATANAGYTFINWTRNGEVVSTTPTFSVTVTESDAYVAHFSLNSSR